MCWMQTHACILCAHISFWIQHLVFAEVRGISPTRRKVPPEVAAPARPSGYQVPVDPCMDGYLIFTLVPFHAIHNSIDPPGPPPEIHSNSTKSIPNHSTTTPKHSKASQNHTKPFQTISEPFKTIERAPRTIPKPPRAALQRIIQNHPKPFRIHPKPYQFILECRSHVLCPSFVILHVWRLAGDCSHVLALR